MGLSPGDGTDPDDPGAGEEREWTEVDLSETGGTYEYVNYEGIYEWWSSLGGAWDGHAFDLADSYLIFTPGSPKYSVTLGTRDMLVDMESLDLAVSSVSDDQDLSESVYQGGLSAGDVRGGQR